MLQVWFFFFVVLPVMRGKGPKAAQYPWEAAEGLEWEVPSPAPFHTYENPPKLDATATKVIHDGAHVHELLGLGFDGLDDALGGVSDGEGSDAAGHVDVGLFRYGQVGVSWLADGGISGSVKVGILSEGISVPAFAIGLENISGENSKRRLPSQPGSRLSNLKQPPSEKTRRAST